jgi:hypothetical protein
LIEIKVGEEVVEVVDKGIRRRAVSPDVLLNERLPSTKFAFLLLRFPALRSRGCGLATTVLAAL